MSTGRQWYPLSGNIGRVRRTAALTGTKKGPVDPLTGPKLALAGKVATMDARYTVKADGVVYIENGAIVAVQARSKAAPAGFAGVAVV